MKPSVFLSQIAKIAISLRRIIYVADYVLVSAALTAFSDPFPRLPEDRDRFDCGCSCSSCIRDDYHWNKVVAPLRRCRGSQSAICQTFKLPRSQLDSSESNVRLTLCRDNNLCPGCCQLILDSCHTIAGEPQGYLVKLNEI